MATISELLVKISADISDFQKDMNTAVGQFDKLTAAANVAAKKMGDVGKSLTMGITLPVAAAGVAMVKLASDTQDSINAVNVIFQGGAQSILDFGDTAAETAGLSKAAFNDVANSMGVLLSKSGKDMQGVAQDTIQLTQRAADLASLLGGTTTEAAQALGSALRGESEPARRYGIILSEAGMKAQAAAMGITGLNGELTEAQKIQVRYAMIMEQSTRATGDFANTNKDTKNSMQVVIAQVKNLAASLGEQLLPIVAKALGQIREMVTKFESLSDGQKKTILVIAGVAAALGPLLVGLSKTVQAINGISVAMKLLQGAGGGPIALAITGVVALGVALVALTRSAQNTKKELAEIERLRLGGSTADAQASIKLVSAEYDRQLKILEDMGKISARSPEQLANQKKLIAAQKELVQSLSDTLKKQIQNVENMQRTAQGTAQITEENKRLEEEKKRLLLIEQQLANASTTLNEIQSSNAIELAELDLWFNALLEEGRQDSIKSNDEKINKIWSAESGYHERSSAAYTNFAAKQKEIDDKLFASKMANIQKTRIQLNNVRLSFANIFEAKSFNGGEARYSASFLISRSINFTTSRYSF